MKKMQVLFFVLTTLVLFSCGSKKKENKDDTNNPSFPIVPFFREQVAHVDTSLYSIIQLNVIDSTRTDTVYVHREEFRGLAKEFLELPDITEKKYHERYKEERMFDQTLQQVIISSQPVNPEKEIIQRQELVITPNLSGGNSDIKSVFIDFLSNSRDSSVQKRMLWQADRSFQVTTIKQLPGKPETITTTKVIWNEPEEQ